MRNFSNSNSRCRHVTVIAITTKIITIIIIMIIIMLRDKLIIRTTAVSQVIK